MQTSAPSQGRSVLNSSILANASATGSEEANNNLRQTSFVGIVSQCSKMKKVFSVVEKVARTDSTVLVLGETGTGKELVARAVHKLSGRTGPLVPVNCGAIPEDILESELFGHEKGSFTGAINSRVGRFQLAHNGTIFLDEIGEMSPKLQVKLLRVLQEKRIEPVGSNKSIEVDVRVIAATNKDLWEEVRAGRFREDLFYRLQVIPIKLPALRERGNDVKILIQYFMQRISQQYGVNITSLTKAAEEKLLSYSWPGNVRELENLIERLAVLAESEQLDVSDLPDHVLGGGAPLAHFEAVEEMPEEGLNFNELVEKYENRLIAMALKKTNGNKKAAARLLRLNRTTLVEKIKKKGLEQGIEVICEDEQDALFA